MATATATSVKSDMFYYTGGSSDKVYKISLLEITGGFTCSFEFGPRGRNLSQPGYSPKKDGSPVDRATAEKSYQDMIKARVKKAYTDDPSGQPGSFTGAFLTGATGSVPASAPVTFGVTAKVPVNDRLPQLLNAVTEAELDNFIKSSEFGAMVKYDGQLAMVSVDKFRTVESSNKLGIMTTNLSTPIRSGIEELFDKAGESTVVGENMGNMLVIFDAIKLNGIDLRKESFSDRIATLKAVGLTSPALFIAPLAIAETAKAAMFERVKSTRGEGVVFQKLDAPYTPGRPNKGSSLKFKFVAEATCEVTAVNVGGKAAFSVAVRDENGVLVPVGNCTVPFNKLMPAVGDFVEIRYMNIQKGGKLYQPFFKELRTDQAEADQYSSLKFKAGNSDADDDE